MFSALFFGCSHDEEGARNRTANPPYPRNQLLGKGRAKSEVK